MQALKGRYIIAQVDRPGLTKATIIPACKVGILRGVLFQLISRMMCRPCRPEYSRIRQPRPNDLGWYVAPLQGLRGRANVALKIIW